MPDREFEYHAEAIKEAWVAFHWYAERSETAAENFWQALRDARQSAMERPQVGIPYFHGTRCR